MLFWTIIGFSVWLWSLMMIPTVHTAEAIIINQTMDNLFLKHERISGKGLSWEKFHQSVKTCGIGNKENSWLITKSVHLGMHQAEEIHVDIEAQLTICTDPGSNRMLPCYSNYFEIHLYYEKRDTLSHPPPLPVYNITNHTSPDSILSRSTQTFSFLGNNSQYITFLIKSTGACGRIFRMKIYYYFCDETFYRVVKFEKTRSASFSNGLQNVTANCSENSKPSKNATNFNGYCYPNGTWQFPAGDNFECLCIEGYTPNEGACSRCSDTSFKNNTSNSNCSECPTGSVSTKTRRGCICKDGYSKLPSASSESSPCYARLALNKKPEVRRIAYGVELKWTAPESSINETIRYDVECYICDKKCITSCRLTCDAKCTNATYDPSSGNLTQTSLTVSNLTNGTTYKFRVYPKNSLNDETSQDKWNYNETDLVVVSSVADPTKPPDTTTSKTKNLGDTSSNDDDKMFIYYIVIGVVVLLLLILIILIIFYVRTRKRGVKKPTNGYLNEGVELPTAGRRMYVDPTNYDSPENAVQEFAKELNPKMIYLARMIGGGEFGDVYQGELTTPDKTKKTIAVKALKHDADAKSERDFMLEASIMGQFDNPNVVRLEGVVTKSLPRMIVLEYMSNGSLDNYLKSNDGLLTHLQLMEMARGVAAGMTYLAEINFVHRDLAARNVLVNERLLCKIADFGLSRVLTDSANTSRGEYSTKGGKIPVRWTAPEAIKFRKFTTASDVWSFGILLWEIMSFAERPYWEWDNIKVINEIERGFRLPTPHNCPKKVHELMLECWNAEKRERPSFVHIKDVIDRWIRSPETMKDEVTDLSPIGKWLTSIKMKTYEDVFLEAGYKSEFELLKVTDVDLITIGVTLIGHRNKILKSIRSLKHKTTQKPPVPPKRKKTLPV